MFGKGTLLWSSRAQTWQELSWLGWWWLGDWLPFPSSLPSAAFLWIFPSHPPLSLLHPPNCCVTFVTLHREPGSDRALQCCVSSLVWVGITSWGLGRDPVSDPLSSPALGAFLMIWTKLTFLTLPTSDRQNLSLSPPVPQISQGHLLFRFFFPKTKNRTGDTRLDIKSVHSRSAGP